MEEETYKIDTGNLTDDCKTALEEHFNKEIDNISDQEITEFLLEN